MHAHMLCPVCFQMNWRGRGGVKGKQHIFMCLAPKMIPPLCLSDCDESQCFGQIGQLNHTVAQWPFHETGDSHKEGPICRDAEAHVRGHRSCCSSQLARVHYSTDACPCELPQAMCVYVCVKIPIKADSSFLPCSPLLWADMFSSPKTPRFHQFNALRAHFLPHSAQITSARLPRVIFEHSSGMSHSNFPTSIYVSQTCRPGVSLNPAADVLYLSQSRPKSQ